MLIKYGNKVAKDFFENYFLMMFQPYNYLKDNYRENIRMWQQMGLYPSDLNMPQDFEKLNSKDIAPSTIKDDSKSDELYDAPVEYRASDVELLMEKMRELEKKVNSLDEEK
jgi:hypothetical protein